MRQMKLTLKMKEIRSLINLKKKKRAVAVSSSMNIQGNHSVLLGGVGGRKKQIQARINLGQSYDLKFKKQTI